MKVTRPNIGACYCKSDAPDRCRWVPEAGSWVGPCVDAAEDDVIEVHLCTEPDCRSTVNEHYHRETP
jgi:hypothetical protein